MAVLALEQFPYSWVEIHTTFGRVRCSNQSSRTNTCSIRQNFKREFAIFIWCGCKIVHWTVCTYASLYLKVMMSRMSKVEKEYLWYQGKQFSSLCVPCTCRMHEKKKKKKRGKEEDHLIFKDHVIVYTDEMARLSMLRQS